MLATYFPWNGNTAKVANIIGDLSGALFFEIATADPYPKECKAVGERPKKEHGSNARQP